MARVSQSIPILAQTGPQNHPRPPCVQPRSPGILVAECWPGFCLHWIFPARRLSEFLQEPGARSTLSPPIGPRTLSVPVGKFSLKVCTCMRQRRSQACPPVAWRQAVGRQPPLATSSPAGAGHLVCAAEGTSLPRHCAAWKPAALCDSETRRERRMCPANTTRSCARAGPAQSTRWWRLHAASAGVSWHLRTLAADGPGAPGEQQEWPGLRTTGD